MTFRGKGLWTTFEATLCLPKAMIFYWGGGCCHSSTILSFMTGLYLPLGLRGLLDDPINRAGCNKVSFQNNSLLLFSASRFGEKNVCDGIPNVAFCISVCK